jgi:hypothetical protein
MVTNIFIEVDPALKRDEIFVQKAATVGVIIARTVIKFVESA